MRFYRFKLLFFNAFRTKEMPERTAFFPVQIARAAG
jgi:hypothetical protein